VIASAAPFFLYNFALRTLSVGRASLFPCLLAPVAAPLAAAYLGTPVSLRDLVAIAVVVLGVLLPALIGGGRLAAVFSGPR
jgi:drug/metabolite transporter (DMT)-like permease